MIGLQNSKDEIAGKFDLVPTVCVSIFCLVYLRNDFHFSEAILHIETVVTFDFDHYLTS